MVTKRVQDIYDPLFVKDVFDRCSAGYRYWSQIASFGFIFLWRRQCVNHMPTILPDGATGPDLMAGTGDVWPYLLRRQAGIASITAVDISSEMIRQAAQEPCRQDQSHRSRHLEEHVRSRIC